MPQNYRWAVPVDNPSCSAKSIYRLSVNTYNFTVIQSFKCTATASIFKNEKSKRFTAIRKVVERKLQMLDSAVTLEFLRSPPGNRLETLVGSRVGQHSIRINDQWRVCFVWTELGPTEVEIVDYH
jgi:toxin HigB-1